MKTFKKNQVIIFVVALMLVAAGYLNYDTNNMSKDIPVSSEIKDNNELAKVGDAELVSSNVDEENVINNTINENTTNALNNNQTAMTSTKVVDEYFTTSRLGRDTMYSQIIDSYQKIIDNANISQEQKAIATQEISKINNTKNAIMISENLIKTKGFEDVVIFVNDKSISIILKGENIEQDKIAQVQNIVARELNSDIENIHISNK